MKGMLFVGSVLACLLVGSGCMTGGYTTYDTGNGPEADSLALSKNDIIDMSRSKVGDDVIIKMIQSTHSYFQLRSRDIVELADSGVSDKVITAMIGTAEPPAVHGSRYYYSPAYYYPPSWWAAYPYYYPWSFGVSLGYYAPYYGYHRYYAPHYGYGGHYVGGGHYATGGHYSGGGGRTIGVRSSGRHR